MEKKNLRAVLVVALLALLLVSLLSCTAAPTATPVPAKPTVPEPVTITFWHIYGPEMGGANAWFNEMVKQFEASNPNVKVKMEVFANDPYKTKLPTAIAAGEAADGFMVYPGAWTEPFARKGIIEQIDKYLDTGGWRDQFVPSSFDECSWDGKTYCVPFSLRTVHVWYNKELFSQNTLTIPKNIGEMEALAATLKSKGITPFAVGMKEGHHGWQWYLSLLGRVGGYEAFADIKQSKAGAWNSPSVIRTFRILQDWTAKGYFNEGATALGIMDVNPPFFTGKTAMIVNGTYFVDQVQSLAGKDWLDNKLGFFNMPLVPDGKGDMGVYHGGVGAAFVVNASSPRKAQVLEFYRYMFTRERVTDASRRTNWVFCMKNTLPADASPFLKSLGDEAAKMKQYIWYIDHTVPPKALLTAYSTLQGIFDRSVTPEQAAAQMEQAVQAAK